MQPSASLLDSRCVQMCVAVSSRHVCWAWGASLYRNLCVVGVCKETHPSLPAPVVQWSQQHHHASLLLLTRLCCLHTCAHNTLPPSVCLLSCTLLSNATVDPPPAPTHTHPPSQEHLPQLESAFKQLGSLIIDVGLKLAGHCSK